MNNPRALRAVWSFRDMHRTVAVCSRLETFALVHHRDLGEFWVPLTELHFIKETLQ